MAFTSLRAKDVDFASAAGTTFTLSPVGADAEVNDLICIGWCANAASVTVSSLNDNSSQPGAANTYTNNTPRSTTACSGGTAYCKVTRRILTTDTITLTLNTSCTRRASNMGIFVPANGNPVLDQLVGVTADTSSPVQYATSGTLAAAASLIVPFGQWRGGAVGSGWVGFGGAGYADLDASSSGGSTSRHEARCRYNLNVGSTSAITISETYTSITTAHGELMTFTDIAVVQRPKLVVVRRTWAGR